MKKLLFALVLVINGVINAENIVDANFASPGPGMFGSRELSLGFKHMEKNSLFGKAHLGTRTIDFYEDNFHAHDSSTFINGALGYTFAIDSDKMLSPYAIVEDDMLPLKNLLNLGVGAEFSAKYNEQISWGIVFEHLLVDPTRNDGLSISSTFFSVPVKYKFTEQLSANFGPNFSVTRASLRNESVSKSFVGIHAGAEFKF